jgi:DNA replication protein DnaC
LETPPLSKVNPPVKTRLQKLPLNELNWDDFERLCLRLARLEADVESCKLYGEPGQKQEGIDIYARQYSNKYIVYQCKRVKNFNPKKIKDAVLKFLNGDLVNKTVIFTLCTTESLRDTKRIKEIEHQREILNKKNIKLSIWDAEELSIKLKNLPEIVDDFFDKPWLKAFCGEEIANKLDKRLGFQEIAEFRKEFLAFYKCLFNTHDPGIPFQLSLEERFIIPNISVKKPMFFDLNEQKIEEKIQEQNLNKYSEEYSKYNTIADIKAKSYENKPQQTSYRDEFSRNLQQYSIVRWLDTPELNKFIILGEPGAGKSTLLRFIAIDLLSKNPKLNSLAKRWGQFLPIWIPFAFCTKLLSNQSAKTISLKKLIQNLLENWDQEKLWPLVEKALEDKRLLLLVDGLDEWSDELSAKIALDKLKIFIELHNITAIFTSRPIGFKRLNIENINWQIGTICDFNTNQQKKLSSIWFTSWIKNQYQNLNYEDVEIKHKADFKTEEFFKELTKSGEFKNLAKNPFLLCILIDLKLQNTRLPQNRFKAYELIIEHFLTRPEKRKSAALINDGSLGFTIDDLKKIIGYMAYKIQNNFTDGLITYNEATNTVKEYLKDCEDGLGFTYREAEKGSKEILEFFEDNIGLLVKKTPYEIGFLHRMLQEFLTAYYLSHRSLNEQLNILKTYCSNPQWKEIILGLFYLTKRGKEIKDFIECLKEKLNFSTTIEKFSIELLLCEITFGEFNCSPKLTQELAQYIFNIIELGNWMRHREKLLSLCLNGLHSIKVRDLVKEKLTCWFPCRKIWRTSIFNGMANWPFLPEVINSLWKGLHDEEIVNQLAASKALTILADGDMEIGNKIAELAQKTIDPYIRAIAIKTLLDGWPDNEIIRRIIEINRYSLIPELRLISIIGKINLNEQNEEDRKELLWLGSNNVRINYHWKGDIITAIIKGWPNSYETRDYCLNSLKEEEKYKQENLDEEIANRVLLEGYPQDDEVVKYCISELDKKYPFIRLDFDAWDLLHKNFKSHPILVKAIDQWILKQDNFHIPECSLASKIGQTPIAKAKLLKGLNYSFPHWPARALIEGWGIENKEILNSLINMANDTKKSDQIAHLFPEIFKDKTECRKRLIELLKDPDTRRIDFVLSGLRKLGVTENDLEIADIIINLVLNRITPEYIDYDTIISYVISHYQDDPRVKNIAKQELIRRKGNYEAVTSNYGKEEDIRKQIINIANPLPANLRKIINKSLREGMGDDEFAISLLKLYDYEENEELKTESSISYHMRLKTSGYDTEKALQELSTNIVSYGFEYQERRLAAFCGLVVLKRLDIMLNTRETRGQDRPCSISISPGFYPNIPLLENILQNWDYIKSSFADEFFIRLFDLKPYSNQLDFWDIFCDMADKYESPRIEALNFLQNRIERTAKPNILHFLDRVMPKSFLLLDYCLNALLTEGESYLSVLAAELLGKHFNKDEKVLTQIMALHNKEKVNLNIIIALCEGWSESKELKNTCKLLVGKRLPYITWFQILSCMTHSDIFSELIKLLTYAEFFPQWQSQAIARPIIRRIQKDNDFTTKIIEHLWNDPTPSEKISLTKLLISAKGISSDLREWCIKEVDNQLMISETSSIGFDLLTGTLQPVVYSLLETLNFLEG